MVTINTYYIDGTTIKPSVAYSEPNLFRAYYIDDVNFSNLTPKDIDTILTKENVIGDLLKDYASSLFCDDANIYILQPQWDAKYRYSNTSATTNSQSLVLRLVVFGTPQTTAPTTGAIMQNTQGQYIPITLGNKVSALAANKLFQLGKQAISRTIDNPIVFAENNITCTSVYKAQGTGYPDAIMCNVLRDASEAQPFGIDSFKSSSGWQYMNNSFIETTASQGYYYHIRNSANVATANKSYCKLFYKNAIVNLALFTSALQDYYVAKNKDDVVSEGIPVVINPAISGYNPLNPFGFINDKDGGFITFFAHSMHAKKLYLSGSSTKYVVLYRNLIDGNTKDGDGTYTFKIPKSSALTESDLVNDAVFVSSETDFCFALLGNNNEPIKILETNNKSTFVLKRNNLVNKEGSGYSNVIYYEKFNTTSMVLIQALDKTALLPLSYEWYIALQWYNVDGDFYRNIPHLQLNATNIFKYSIQDNAWLLSTAKYADSGVELLDGYGENTTQNTYVKEFTVTKSNFPTNSFKLDQSLIPTITQFNNNDGGGNQLLCGLNWVFAGYDKSAIKSSYVTTNNNDYKVGSTLNGFLKLAQ